MLLMIAFNIPNIAGTIVLLNVTGSNSTKGGLVAANYCMQVFGAVSLSSRLINKVTDESSATLRSSSCPVETLRVCQEKYHLRCQE